MVIIVFLWTKSNDNQIKSDLELTIRFKVFIDRSITFDADDYTIQNTEPEKGNFNGCGSCRIFGNYILMCISLAETNPNANVY